VLLGVSTTQEQEGRKEGRKDPAQTTRARARAGSMGHCRWATVTGSMSVVSVDGQRNLGREPQQRRHREGDRAAQWRRAMSLDG
jgi:hypothetical protein